MERILVVIIIYIFLIGKAFSQLTMEEQFIKQEKFLTENFDVGEDFFLRESTDSLYLKIMYSYYLIKNGNILKAIDEIEKVESPDNNYMKSLKTMVEALIQFKKNDLGNSKILFEKALELDKYRNNKWLRLELFRFYFGNEDFKAWGYLDEAIKIDSNFFPALIERAFLYDDTDNCQDIINDLKDIPENYGDSEVFNLLGVAYANCGKIEESINNIEKALSINENTNNCLSMAQIQHNYIKDRIVAERYYLKSYELDPNNLDALNYYAWFNYDYGNLNKADNLFSLLLEKDSSLETYLQVITYKLLSRKDKEAYDLISNSLKLHNENYINEGLQIIYKIYEKENYENLIKQYRSKYTSEEVDWLKEQIVFFFN